MAISANDIRKRDGDPARGRSRKGDGVSSTTRPATCARWFRHVCAICSREILLNTASRSNDTLEKITLDRNKMEYLYSDGSHHHFMNSENYEQVALTEDEGRRRTVG